MDGLEIARLAVDCCYRDFVIARYETEKRLVKRDRLRSWTAVAGPFPVHLISTSGPAD